MSAPTRLTAVLLVLGAFSGTAIPADPADANLDRAFAETVHPFLATYCTGCHGGEKPMAQFDLKQYSNLTSVVRDYSRWALVGERLTAKTMPPQAAKQPDAAARQKVVDWIGAMLKNEARKTAGDPGVVLARRLSNAEYNYTIRDLTGVDVHPAREFPVDPANTAGFDNSGESLGMPPALLNKCLQAAHEVASHLILTEDGFTFSPYAMLAQTDREKFAIQRIVDFYERQPTDFADYFRAAWLYRHRAVFGKAPASLSEIAAESKVSPKYLAMVWEALESKEEIAPVPKGETTS